MSASTHEGMNLSVPALDIDNPVAQRAIHPIDGSGQKFDDVESTMDIRISDLLLRHHGPDKKFRPYLQVYGEMLEVFPGNDLPDGIASVTFDPANLPKVNMRYDFSDAQLVELIAKGYYTDAFAMEDGVIESEMNLPVNASFIVIPKDSEHDTPIVFADVKDRSQLIFDEETSGYNLTEVYAEPAQETKLIEEPEHFAEPQSELDMLAEENARVLAEAQNEATLQSEIGTLDYAAMESEVEAKVLPPVERDPRSVEALSEQVRENAQDVLVSTQVNSDESSAMSEPDDMFAEENAEYDASDEDLEHVDVVMPIATGDHKPSKAKVKNSTRAQTFLNQMHDEEVERESPDSHPSSMDR